MEQLEANGTMNEVSKIILPYRLDLMDFEHVNCQLLLSSRLKGAVRLTARKGSRLLGRATGPRPSGRNNAIGISKFRKLFNLPSK
jgi:hypothetical protein